MKKKFQCVWCKKEVREEPMHKTGFGSFVCDNCHKSWFKQQIVEKSQSNKKPWLRRKWG